MQAPESFIQTVATELDGLVSAARPNLEASGVDIQTDSPSGRDYTIWTGRFTKCRPGPTGFEQTTVIFLNCMLPLHPTQVKDLEVDFHAIAEIFQIGKSSRVRSDSKGKLILGQLLSSGIERMILEKIEGGVIC